MSMRYAIILGPLVFGGNLDLGSLSGSVYAGPETGKRTPFISKHAYTTAMARLRMFGLSTPSIIRQVRKTALTCEWEQMYTPDPIPIHSPQASHVCLHSEETATNTN